MSNEIRPILFNPRSVGETSFIEGSESVAPIDRKITGVVGQSPWYNETLHATWGQRFIIKKTLHREQTNRQDLIIFTHEIFGKVLALDGVIQLTTKDEHIYHEMIAHVPLLAHGNARKVLIIGGGDGGVAREVLRHKTVKEVILVEIDPSVINFSKQHLPEVSCGAFENERLKVVIADGAKFVQETKERFDVIIVDSTDPIGPGEVLFTSEFYGNCAKIFSDNRGILVTQNGVPILQPKEVTDSYRNFGPYFAVRTFYRASVPTYVGGAMTLGFATNNPHARDVSTGELSMRFDQIEGKEKLGYYTPEMHCAAFALPPNIQGLMKDE